MRIGIDARMYCEGLGIGRYIQQLISNLEKIEDQNEIIVFLRKKIGISTLLPTRVFQKYLQTFLGTLSLSRRFFRD